MRALLVRPLEDIDPDRLSQIFTGFAAAFNALAYDLAEVRETMPSWGEIIDLFFEGDYWGIIEELDSVRQGMAEIAEAAADIDADMEILLEELSPETLELFDGDIRMVDLFAANLETEAEAVAAGAEMIEDWLFIALFF